MKKLLSILIAVIMCCAVTVTAFAATPDEAPAKDMQEVIKQAMLNNYYKDVKPKELEIRILGGNENGSVYFEHTDDLAHTELIYNVQINDYYAYKYTEFDEMLVYNNGKIYAVKKAYTSGIISDKDIADIAEWNDAFYGSVPGYDVNDAIKQAMLNYYYTDVMPSNIEIYVVGVTSNHCICFKYDDRLPRADVIIETILGRYKYKYTDSEKTLMYKDGKIYDIPSAYKSGIIDDDILAELVDFNIGIMLNSNSNENPSTTSPAATSATKPVSTSDTATNDTPNNSQNNSGAVQTGQNSVAVILLVATLAGCAVIFAKRRNYFK